MSSNLPEFEKSFTQKQKETGSYYTKEDVTDYICRNTILPYLFDVARQKCPAAFEPGSFIWRHLADNPDRYLYSSLRHGVLDSQGEVIPLPADIQEGIQDIQRRDRWNRLASALYALPTETWREHIARRQRCLDLRQKLQNGQVSRINDLITCNLDIQQFAIDTIAGCQGPDLLRVFYQAIATITILDPTCGCGAFLVAALKVLQPLCEACLDRMQALVDDRTASGKSAAPDQRAEFRSILAEAARHPNRGCFIVHSIISNNLYGVDLLKEAVEICQHRLLLELAAQGEARPARESPGLKPVPDLHSNIRPGNTLVGCATREEAGQALAGRAGSTSDLTQQLDRCLAGQDGVAADQPGQLAQWRDRNQPFHWFAEFPTILAAGGFDVIVGNPPYVKYREVKDRYSVRDLASLPCGDLYAFCTEKALRLLRPGGRIGEIVPISLFGTDGFQSLQRILLRSLDVAWTSFFANRPAQLFDGAQKRLTILLGRRNATEQAEIRTTRYFRCRKEERPHLFRSRIEYAVPQPAFSVFPGSLEKLGSDLEVNAFRRLVSAPGRLSIAAVKTSNHKVYYTRKFGYFLAFLDFVPEITEIQTGRQVPPSELKSLALGSREAVYCVIAALSSSTFFWFWNVVSDCRNLNRRDLLAFPFQPELVPEPFRRELAKRGQQLLRALRRSSRTMVKSGLSIQTFDYASCKPILDSIDRLLARHYGFTDPEVDFILNHDVKYRIGLEEAATAGQDAVPTPRGSGFQS